jgi:hypothetical protein
MDELLDAIVTDESPSQISDMVKDILFAKASERVDAFKPVAASSVFGNDEISAELDAELDVEGEE